MNEIYSERCLYKDTYTIINMMENNLKSKINPKFIEFLKENQDEQYQTCINIEIPLKEQKLREEIKLMLSIIYINYLCEPLERKMILKEENDNIQMYNKQLYENMFKKNTENINDNKDKQLIVIKEKNIIQKLIDKIKTVFKLKK